ncbi:MAG TPA: hypothetical protein VKE42_05095, partial [Candidatus Cybelea sp.]|nr:hypothetical protein [Candidatus Cybelea sp.]
MTLRTLALYAFAASCASAALCGCSSTPGLPQTASDAAVRSSDIPVTPSSIPVTPFSAPESIFPGETLTGPTGIRKLLISATITIKPTSGSSYTVGGMYDREAGTWVPVTVPHASSTAAYGPESIPNGFRVVGSYKVNGQNGDSGFEYDSVSNRFRKIVAPPYACAPHSCNFTIAHSVFQNRSNYLVVGNYDA